MDEGSLGAALEREHREIDEGVAEFVSALPAAQAAVDSLSRAIAALRRHIYLEEEFLFPALQADGLVAPVFVMLREHGQLWQSMDRIEATLAAGSDPNAAAASCHELVTQLDAHNSKEEPILYPQVDRVLTGEAGEQFAQFLASGEMPAGWVCQRAAA